MSWIQEIQNKPLSYRKKVLNIILICTVVILALLWIFLGRSSNKGNDGPGLFDTIKEKFTNNQIDVKSLKPNTTNANGQTTTK